MWSKWEWLHIIDTLTELAAVRAESGIRPLSMPIGASQSKEKSNKRSKEELDNHDIERFSNDCRKTKAKAITRINHNRNKQHDEPITIPSNHL